MIYGETWEAILGLMKYHMKALITLRRGLNFLLPLPKPKLSFLSLITSQDFFK